MDECKRTKAKQLPASWEWHDWSDGSGALCSPDGQWYYEYDLTPYGGIGEIEFRPTEKSHWKIFTGTLSEFKSYCEKQMKMMLEQQDQIDTTSLCGMLLR